MTTEQKRVLMKCLAQFDVNIFDFLDGRVLPTVVDARHAFWIVLRMQGNSYQAIGKLTGHDHKTVMHGCRLDRYHQLLNHINAIREKLKENA